jgi:hypothetical protein
MHENGNTAWSIIHGPIALGGMALPDLYTLQGIVKLNLFVGHSWLGGTTADLLYINLSILQLLLGHGTLILNANHSNYTWVEEGWLTSMWAFLNEANVSLEYPDCWKPSLPREND